MHERKEKKKKKENTKQLPPVKIAKNESSRVRETSIEAVFGVDFLQVRRAAETKGKLSSNILIASYRTG